MTHSPLIVSRKSDKAAKQTLNPEHAEAVQDAARSSVSANTKRTYASLANDFLRFCEAHGYAFPASPETVAAYLSDMAARGKSVSTVKTARAAIRALHAGQDDPTAHEGVKAVLRGLSRQGAPQKQKQGLTDAQFARILATARLPRRMGRGMESASAADARGRMDVALVSIMRDALLRRSEVVALRWADLRREADGSGRLTILRSKTDQEGAGAIMFLSGATVEALQAIRGDAAADDYIFPFRSGQSVAKRVKKMCAAAGLDGDYSGHSARVGMACDLVREGFSLVAVQNAGRWKSPAMPGRYARGELAGRGAVARYHAKRA